MSRVSAHGRWRATAFKVSWTTNRRAEPLALVMATLTLAFPAVCDHHFGVMLPVLTLMLPAWMTQQQGRWEPLTVLGVCYALIATILLRWPIISQRDRSIFCRATGSSQHRGAHAAASHLSAPADAAFMCHAKDVRKEEVRAGVSRVDEWREHLQQAAVLIARRFVRRLC